MEGQPNSPGSEAQALQDAMGRLLDALARLAVARGVPYAAIDEMTKRAFVRAASAAHPGLPEHRKVSRISTATGINRREVTRLVGSADDAPQRARSLPSEVFAHWVTDRRYRDAAGEPRTLPRQGPAPSFESLAHAITRDVHPRSLLDELLRLGLARLDEAGDTVTLVQDGFVPRGDVVRMLGFLADNVGDHLNAAVANVLGDGRSHFEQAIFAEGLSEASMEGIRSAIKRQWQGTLDVLVPTLEAAIEADARIEPPPQRRLRIGLYTYEDAGADAPTPAPAPRAARLSRPAQGDGSAGAPASPQRRRSARRDPPAEDL